MTGKVTARSVNSMNSRLKKKSVFGFSIALYESNGTNHLLSEFNDTNHLLSVPKQ